MDGDDIDRIGQIKMAQGLIVPLLALQKNYEEGRGGGGLVELG
jgi:hypothetical protein